MKDSQVSNISQRRLHGHDETKTIQQFAQFVKSAARCVRRHAIPFSKTKEEAEVEDAMTAVHAEGWLDNSEFLALDMNEKELAIACVALSRMASASSSFYTSRCQRNKS